MSFRIVHLALEDGRASAYQEQTAEIAREPANETPRHETRRKWPRESPCATPWATVKGRRGVRLELDAGYLAGRRHLPVIRLRAVA